MPELIGLGAGYSREQATAKLYLINGSAHVPICLPGGSISGILSLKFIDKSALGACDGRLLSLANALLISHIEGIIKSKLDVVLTLK